MKNREMNRLINTCPYFPSPQNQTSLEPKIDSDSVELMPPPVSGVTVAIINLPFFEKNVQLS